MTRRPSAVKRSSVVEVERDGWWKAGGKTGGGTTRATSVPAPGDSPSAVLLSSVRDLAGAGSGASTDWLVEHWQSWPRVFSPLAQLQVPWPPQQLRGFADEAAVPRAQQGRLGRDRLTQCGQAGAGAASRLARGPPTGCAALPQLQAIKGRDWAGTSKAASHTRALAIMVFDNSMGQLPKSLRCPIGRGAPSIDAYPIDAATTLTLCFRPIQVNNDVTAAGTRFERITSQLRNRLAERDV